MTEEQFDFYRGRFVRNDMITVKPYQKEPLTIQLAVVAKKNGETIIIDIAGHEYKISDIESISPAAGYS